MKRFQEAKKKRVTEVDPKRHKTVDKDGSGAGCERRKETVNITKMKTNRLSNIIDVGCEGLWGVQDDTQTPDLQ